MEKALFQIQSNKQGKPALTLMKGGLLYEDEISWATVPQDFLSDKEPKKLIFIAPGAYINLDPNKARRSTDIRRCDAVCIHECITPNDRSAYLAEIAPITRDNLRAFISHFKFQVAPFETDITTHEVFIGRTPESEAFLTSIGVNPEWKAAYKGLQYKDIEESKLPIFTDSSFTIFQNIGGAKFDQEACDSLKEMLDSGNSDTKKIAIMSASYYDISDDESKKFAQQFLDSMSSSDMTAMTNTSAGRAFVNAVTGTIKQ